MGTGASPLLFGVPSWYVSWQILSVLTLVPGTHVPGMTTGQLPCMGQGALEQLLPHRRAALTSA